MSSDKHAPSPRHSRSSPSSSASVDSNSLSVAASSSTSASVVVPAAAVLPTPTPGPVTGSESCHILGNVSERLSVDDDSSASFEDKSLWSDSFAMLYQFFQTGTFCDVEIRVGSQCINCHRLVLACFSQYFR